MHAGRRGRSRALRLRADAPLPKTAALHLYGVRGSCHLVVHPKGTVMWDGAFKPDGSPVTQGKGTISRATKTLKSQFAAAGYKPADITYLAMPGHQMLYLKLVKTGPALVAGDLYHHPEERTTGKVPTSQ